MAETSFFFSGGGATYSQADFAEMVVRYLGDGYLYGNLNALAVSASTPNAMTVVVATGRAQVQGYGYYNSAAKTLTIDAADPTNPRIDRIILRLTFTGAPGTIIATVLKGTPAASPTAPALTQNATYWELSLAQVRVDALETAIATGDITDERNTTYCGRAKPYNSTGTAAAYQIPESDSGGKIDTWVSDAAAGTKGKIQLTNALGGSAAAPTVVKVKESGGTDMAVGSVPDGYCLQRSGTSLIGAIPTNCVAVASAITTINNSDALNVLATYTVPVNTMAVGTTFRVMGMGTNFHMTASNYFLIYFYLGANCVKILYYSQAGVAVDDAAIFWEGTVTVTATGGSGAFMGGIWAMSSRAAVPGWVASDAVPLYWNASTDIATQAVDTTAANTLKCEVRFNTASVNANVSIVSCTIEQVK